MVLQIYRRVDPIEACEPKTIASKNDAKKGSGGFTFTVTTLEPKTHKLDVRFHILPENKAIRATSDARIPDRKKRGKLQPIADKGKAAGYVGRGRSKFRIAAGDLAPGRYQVVCRVRDDAKPSGQARPWVLKDTVDLLASERVWWIEVPAR